MNVRFTIAWLFLFCNSSFAQIKNSDALLSAMLKRYTGKWCHSVTFTQNTYRPNDSLNQHMVWYEAIEYPDKFRIDFNSIALGNAALFRNDTAYRFRNKILKDTRPDKNDLLLLLGGMYFRTKEDIVRRLAALSYDLGKFSERTWNNDPVYIIGAVAGDTAGNQVWIDKKHLCVVRNITHLSPYEVLDMRVESRIPSCGGFIETRVAFYINGRLDQLEEYHDIQSNPQINPAVFDPKKFGTIHWKKSTSAPKSH